MIGNNRGMCFANGPMTKTKRIKTKNELISQVVKYVLEDYDLNVGIGVTVGLVQLMT